MVLAQATASSLATSLGGADRDREQNLWPTDETVLRFLVHVRTARRVPGPQGSPTMPVYDGPTDQQ